MFWFFDFFSRISSLATNRAPVHHPRVALDSTALPVRTKESL